MTKYSIHNFYFHSLKFDPLKHRYYSCERLMLSQRERRRPVVNPEPAPSAQPDQFLLDLTGGDAKSLKIELYSRLAARFLPGSPYEQLRVEEMAAAWLEVWNLRGQMAATRQFLRREAAQRYEEKTRLHYQKLDKGLLRSHGANQQALAAHAYGAELLADRWREFYLHTAEQKPLEIHQICAILVAEGCSDLMQAMDRRAVWLVTRMMKRYNNPDYLAREWADYSRLRPEQAMPLMERVVEETEKLPSFDEAFSQLLDHAHQKQEFWTTRAKALLPDHLQQKAAFCQGYLGFPGAAPGIRSLIGLERLQISRITQLEREFRQLQRERQRDEDRAREQAARLEAIRIGLILPHKKPLKTGTPTHADKRTPEMPMEPNPACTEKQAGASLENAIVAPADDFPEVDLVQAVVAAAIETADEPKNHSDGHQEARRLVASLAGANLAEATNLSTFDRLFTHARHNLPESPDGDNHVERSRRALIRNFQPAG